MSLHTTASQTVGPFLHIGLPNHASLCDAATQGQRIVLQGRVTDGDGAPVTDALVEIWQANAQGQYVDPAFQGFGRCATNSAGVFRFETIKPGAVASGDGSFQAPHVVVALFMRGLLRHLYSRIYFADEATNARDAVLLRVPEARRPTLLASATPDGYQWNVVLQGAGETVFFDI